MDLRTSILIVDDSHDIRALLETAFEAADFRVLSASSGNQAFKLYLKDPVNVVLSDVQMADGDGLWLSAELVNLDIRPILFLMNGNVSFSREAADHAGADALLHKPFSAKAVVSAVRALHDSIYFGKAL